MSQNPAFSQVTPSLTTNFPSGVPAGSAAVFEALISGYAQVYNGAALTGATGTTVGSVDDNGKAIINMTDGSYDLITVAGVVTHFTTKIGGGEPVIQGAISIGGTHRVYLDDSSIGFLYFKNGAFVAEYVATQAHAPTGVAMSPSGKYVLLIDHTANTAELWVGS